MVERQGSRVCVLINSRFLVPLELLGIVLLLVIVIGTRFFYPCATRKTPGQVNRKRHSVPDIVLYQDLQYY